MAKLPARKKTLRRTAANKGTNIHFYVSTLSSSLNMGANFATEQRKVSPICSAF